MPGPGADENAQQSFLYARNLGKVRFKKPDSCTEIQGWP